MPNTYTQIHIHCIFAIKYRDAMINKEWETRLHQYISAILQNQGHKMIVINYMPGHIHLFFGMRPNQSLSDLMRIVKGDSSEWLNQQRLTAKQFRWQEGYGAFSYEKKKIAVVAAYIENQEIHHAKKTFLEEYREILNNFAVEFDEQYLFKEPQ